MVYAIGRFKFWKYLQGDFLYRVHKRWRKVLPTLTQRIKEMFDYAG